MLGCARSRRRTGQCGPASMAGVESLRGDEGADGGGGVAGLSE